MIEQPGDLNLVDEGFFSVLLGKSRLFSEGFNGHFFMIFQLGSQVHGGKVSFS